MGVFRIMEEWKDCEDDPITNQEKRVLARQKRHRDDLRQNPAGGTQHVIPPGVLRRQHEESCRLNKECSAYWVWHAATKYEQEMAEQYGLYPARVDGTMQAH
jgi:hypothetical protein